MATAGPAVWRGASPWYDALLSFTPYRDTLNRIARELPRDGAGARVLDAGAGTGNLSLSLAASGFEVTGVDISAAMLARAERKRRHRGLDSARFVRADLQSPLPFAGESFDYVVSMHACHLLRDRAFAFREFRRVLKQGGLLVISDLRRPIRLRLALADSKRREGWLETARMCLRLAPLMPFLAVLNIGLWRRSRNGPPRALERELEAAGFEVVGAVPCYATGSAVLATCRKAGASATPAIEGREAVAGGTR